MYINTNELEPQNFESVQQKYLNFLMFGVKKKSHVFCYQALKS